MGAERVVCQKSECHAASVTNSVKSIRLARRHRNSTGLARRARVSAAGPPDPKVAALCRTDLAGAASCIMGSGAAGIKRSWRMTFSSRQTGKRDECAIGWLTNTVPAGVH
jgi:hypothetical protein